MPRRTSSSRRMSTARGRGASARLPNPYAANTAKVRVFVEEHFPGSLLKDAHQGLVHYHVPFSAMTWSRIFEIMEEGKEACGIADYSIGQTSLEQVSHVTTVVSSGPPVAVVSEHVGWF